ncbi:MAG: zinc ribbon domain-containing protein [Gammaproteobacteria bacterium]|nr:zinc ribbon domain-containing protein [Gammaproteobacteria bacterium]
MPIYEYQCTACGHMFDTLQKISDEPLTDCPACEKATLQKQVSATSFQLKGTGWYATDFRNKPTETKKESAVSAVPGDSKKEATPSTDKPKTDSTGT